MAIAYTNLNDAIARTIERTGGYAAESDAPLISELLQLSAAADANGTIHYRVFLVAALFLEQSPAVQTLVQAEDGVKFSQLVTTIASLRSLQAGVDAANGLTIPAGFEAATNDKKVRLHKSFSSISLPLKVV